MKDDETKYTYEEVIGFCKSYEIYIAPRDSTVEFLKEAGKEFDDILPEIRELKAINACADVELDYGKNRKGYVYQFKKLVFEKYWCYIKLKIKCDVIKIVWVLSFHKEEYDYENKRC